VSPAERVRRLVDGELDAVQAAALRADAERDPALAAELRAALEVQEALRSFEAPEVPDDLVDGAVLRAVRHRAELDAAPAPFWRRARSRLARPRLHPALWVGLGAVITVALFALAPRSSTPVAAPETEAEAQPESGEALVRFVLPAEGARTVAVAGDFNGWRTDDAVLEDPEGDGVFVGALRVPSGSYAYMFVVDGERWVSDPYATNYREDGFGHRNAILRVD